MRYLFIGIVALVMIAGGLGHLLQPTYFAAFVPSGWPVQAILVSTGVLQIGIGLAVLWPRYRGMAALAFALLCLAYVPLHVWDFFRVQPVFAPVSAAWIRLAVQVGFIAVGLALWRQQTNLSHKGAAA
jgi:uncharacterized membrane protein